MKAPPLSDADAAYYAETMSDIERRVVAMCSIERSLGYARLAEKLDVLYSDLQTVGTNLRGMSLAKIVPVRRGREFAGSAIFLNERGEQVQVAINKKHLGL